MTRNRVRQLGFWVLALILLLLSSCAEEDLTPPAPEQSIKIDPNPDEINAGWTLVTPQSLLIVGQGDSTVTDLEPGDYSLSWGEVTGWIRPDPATLENNLAANGSLTFTGTYTEDLQIPPLGMIPLNPGNFLMGSPAGELGSSDEERPQHQVTLSSQFGALQPFEIAATEVTQYLWRAVMGGNNPSWFAPCDDCPVERVSFYDILRFCNELSARQGLPKAYRETQWGWIWDPDSTGYRLPTEAEWEFACRAGSQTALSNGEVGGVACWRDPTLDQMGWFCGNAGGETHPVAGKTPNAWGLYDMHGNVWEWVWDLYGPYSSAAEENPTGPAQGSFQVIRGGSWLYGIRRCRSAYRYRASPGSVSSDLGFRIARFLTDGGTQPQGQEVGP